MNSGAPANEAGISGPEMMGKVLVVDDEELVLAALRDTLQREGYSVVAHLNPLEALETLAREPLAVVIADQRMPHLSGLELLDRTRQSQPDASRILITGVLSLDTVIAAINCGEIYRFIVKPWLREELLATVRNAVQRFDLLRSNRAWQDETRAVNDRLMQLNQSLEQQVRRAGEQNRQLSGLNESLNQNLDCMLKLCGQSLGIFCPVLGTQARRTLQICTAFAETLALPPDQRRVLETSARLYDLGLLGVPRDLIRAWQENPAQLSDAQWAIIRQHPAVGQELLSLADALAPAGEIIRAHHERFDGGGYPDRISGESIPWLARLLAVAVAYASSANPGAAALDVMREQSGRAFDPRAVRVFLNVIPRLAMTRREKEVELSQLEPGMVLARGVYSIGGTLILPEGAELNAAELEKLRGHTRLHVLHQVLAVYC
jgi:response regulator RpfG family c-di-GMP phosphodiesterase